MAKGLINNSTLTDIANAIRAKMGTSDAMLPSEMASLIQSISVGYKVAWGSFTPSGSYTTTVTITHNLGVVPNLIAIFPSAGMGSYNSRLISLSVMPGDQYITQVYYSDMATILSTSLTNNATNLAKAFPTLTETTLTAKSSGIQKSIYFNPGKYVWIAAEVSA